MRLEASDESERDEPRSLSDLEAGLVAHLLRLASAENAALLAQLVGARVRGMDDGGQGSLRFEQSQPPRRFGQQVAEYRFEDSDGVPVSATLNLDQLGDLYELDIFKGDFGRLVATPTIDD